MVFNRLELPPNTLGCGDDGEDEDGEDEETKNKKNIKKSKSVTLSKNKKIEVKQSKEQKNGIKTIGKKKGEKNEIVGEEVEDVHEEKKGRSTISRSVKVLGTKIVVKSDIDVKGNTKIRGKKAVEKMEMEDVKEFDAVEVNSDKETKAKGSGKRKRAQNSALSSSNTDDKREVGGADADYPIPTAKRTRSSRIIK